MRTLSNEESIIIAIISGSETLLFTVANGYSLQLFVVELSHCVIIGFDSFSNETDRPSSI